jgi:hypothetical protein
MMQQEFLLDCFTATQFAMTCTVLFLRIVSGFALRVTRWAAMTGCGWGRCGAGLVVAPICLHKLFYLPLLHQLKANDFI